MIDTKIHTIAARHAEKWRTSTVGPSGLEDYIADAIAEALDTLTPTDIVEELVRASRDADAWRRKYLAASDKRRRLAPK